MGEGGIAPGDSRRFYIQLPGVDVALFLMAVIGPVALMFGASGGVFVVVVTANFLVYAALVSLVLVVLKVFKKQS